jgi:hypothetical protein
VGVLPAVMLQLRRLERTDISLRSFLHPVPRFLCPLFHARAPRLPKRTAMAASLAGGGVLPHSDVLLLTLATSFPHPGILTHQERPTPVDLVALSATRRDT